jgi:LuxR family maltose regulon positive regulatory protein
MNLALISIIVGLGLFNDISKELFISSNTTQWHISRIYSKLGVKSRTQAIVKGKAMGILK